MQELISWIKRLPNRLLEPLGLSLVRRSQASTTPEAALQRLQQLGIQPGSVIDVGAAIGEWSMASRELFPHARHYLIEPLAEFAPNLRKLADEESLFTFIAGAAGSFDGSLDLNIHEDLFGSSTLREPAVEDSVREVRQVRAMRLDSLLEELRPPPPHVVKLDVQGAEMDVVAGASSLLTSTEAIFIETLFFEFFEGGSLFHDVVGEMASRGFVVYDIVEPARRPLDGALAQVDLVFLPTTSRLRTSHIYASPAQRQRLDDRFKSVHATHGIDRSRSRDENLERK